MGKVLSTRETVRDIAGDARGAVLVEAAIVLPIVIVLLLGIVSYSGWFMAAHSLQQAANDAARAAMAGLDNDERREIVDESLEHSVMAAGTLNPDLVDVATTQDGAFYTVSLTYDVAASNIFRVSLVPLPGPAIERDAVIRLHEL